MDMRDGIFEKEWYAAIAREKIKPNSPNFRIFCVGWLETGGPPETWDTLEVIGAEFREAKSGHHKGKLTIRVPGTTRTAYVHKSERPHTLP
ncbi:hypothetical protein KDW07_26830 [Burkholderia dolosa]|uniref:hypothetical protein n=1 Tax=Burkholderia dolosa TaxID=152500 RepID=UPI001B93052E|nr:hypothetical protein [Burkholderia dolosa]MBR8460759.1 hypothetical protein [Burkholderia dolosa]